MMKKLVYLVLVLAVGSAASALSGNVLEDFESYAVGSYLDENGWNALSSRVVIVNGANGTKATQVDTAYGSYFQVDTTSTGDPYTPWFTNPLGSGYTGPAHMAMTLTAGVYDDTWGMETLTGYPGPIIGGGVETGHPGKGDFQVQGGMWGTTTRSTDTFDRLDTVDLVLNMDLPATGNVTGTLYYKNLTDGETTFTRTSIVDKDLNVTSAFMTTLVNLYMRGGAYIGEQDDLAFGVGHVPEPCTIALLGLGGLLLRKRR